MDLQEAIRARHSVRRYTEEPLREAHAAALREEIERVNALSGLNIQLVTGEPKAFDGFRAHYGWLRGVTDYIALVGSKDAELEEACGYWGEHLVLFAQMLGINSCWVAATYKKIKTAYTVRKGEKMLLVIALGYGENQGSERKSKSYEKVTKNAENAPDWFKRGVESALLAPTAVNQQRFRFSLDGNIVTAVSTGGAWSKVDLGIVKYHFEAAAGPENFKWG